MRSALLLLVLAIGTTDAGAEVTRFGARVEFAGVWQAKNDVQIPNAPPATRFSLVDLVGSGPVPAVRVDLYWNVDERHQVHALLAPLALEESGTPPTALTFAGEDFVAGEQVTATYRFDSWRVGYRYRLADGERGEAWIGFTAKLRDAEVKLVQGERSADDTDLGFVPLLHLAGRRFVTDTISGWIEVEGLAGGPGRAVDAAAMLRYGRRDGWGLSVGYRTIEGGADVDAVYNFAWLNYAVIAVDAPLR